MYLIVIEDMIVIHSIGSDLSIQYLDSIYHFVYVLEISLVGTKLIRLWIKFMRLAILYPVCSLCSQCSHMSGHSCDAVIYYRGACNIRSVGVFAYRTSCISAVFRNILLQCSRESCDVTAAQALPTHWLDGAVNVTSYLILITLILSFYTEKYLILNGQDGAM